MVSLDVLRLLDCLFVLWSRGRPARFTKNVPTVRQSDALAGIEPRALTYLYGEPNRRPQRPVGMRIMRLVGPSRRIARAAALPSAQAYSAT